jgi:hypothetical protein
MPFTALRRHEACDGSSDEPDWQPMEELARRPDMHSVS